MESQTRPDEVSPPEIDAGEISAFPDLDTVRQRAETAKSLARWLVVVFAGSLVLHYFAVWVLIHYDKEAGLQILSSAFNAWLPVISSLLSAAATYYFTRERG